MGTIREKEYFVTIQKLLVSVNIKITIFWNMMTYRLIDRCHCFGGTSHLHVQDMPTLGVYPEDIEAKFFQSSHIFQPKYTVSHSRRL
jgi:hypothetical protein